MFFTVTVSIYIPTSSIEAMPFESFFSSFSLHLTLYTLDSVIAVLLFSYPQYSVSFFSHCRGSLIINAFELLIPLLRK